MRLHGAVTVQDVLETLRGREGRIESSTGVQLEVAAARAVRRRAREAAGPRQIMTAIAADEFSRSAPYVDEAMPHPKHTTDPWAAMDRAELSVFRDVGPLGCLSDLCTVKWAPSGPIKCPTLLITLHAKIPHRTQGEIVVLVLRAYQEWALMSEERALAQVAAWSSSASGGRVYNAHTLAQDFREGRMAATRKRAAGLYADSLLVLSAWVQIWNRRSKSTRA